MLTLLIAAMLLPAVTATPQSSDAKKPVGEDWKISGWETTTCCCKDICPCRFNEKPTNNECESTISVHIDKGNYGKARLDGVNFVIVGRGFDQGKGWNRIYIDEKASPEQQQAVGGVLTSMISSYKPETAALVYGKDSRGVKLVPMTFTSSHEGLVREVKVPGVCHVRVRIGKVPGAKLPVHIIGVLTEFSPIFYPAAEVMARVEKGEVPFDHPVHARAEVEDFTLTRDDYATRRIGFQSYTGRGGCLLPSN